MVDYLACLKRLRGSNEPECRRLAKAYLQCRMDRNLMLRDDFKNLGFAEEVDQRTVEGSMGATASMGAIAPSSMAVTAATTAPIAEKTMPTVVVGTARKS
ncbi:MAG: Cytochrome c oxidase assembly protein cox19 [Phylliscum demangeonii]|nr:MAG: Cytochrome c oxidase assembly protein cox19 [Phylliscum demangeonii]